MRDNFFQIQGQGQGHGHGSPKVGFVPGAWSSDTEFRLFGESAKYRIICSRKCIFSDMH